MAQLLAECAGMPLRNRRLYRLTAYEFPRCPTCLGRYTFDGGRLLDLTLDPDSGDGHGRERAGRTRQWNRCRSTDRGAFRGPPDGVSEAVGRRFESCRRHVDLGLVGLERPRVAARLT
jgi:hypothetical protein